MNFRIRPALATDVDHIAQFQLDMAMETEHKTLDRDTVRRAVRKVLDDPARGFYLVAVESGPVVEDESDWQAGSPPVGSLLVTTEWSDWRDSYLWYIQSVFVAPALRRQGIFRQLYEEVLRRARAEQIAFVRLYVETENLRAQQVYESLGMKRLPYYMYDIALDPRLSAELSPER